MSNLIIARHPVPVRFMPRAGKFERTGFVMVDTPVRLREIEPGEPTDLMRWLGPLKREYALVGADGGLWLRAGKKSSATASPGSVATFVEQVRRGQFQDSQHMGTPLDMDGSAVFQKGSMPIVGSMSDIPGTVVEGYEAEARASLLRLFEEDVVAAGDTILFRARPLAKLMFGVVAHLETHGTDVPGLDPCSGLDRVEEADAAMFGSGRKVQIDPLLASAMVAVEGRLRGDEDLRHYANTVPGALWGMFLDHNLKATDEQRRAGSALRRFEALGAIGAVESHEWDAAIAAAVRFHDEVVMPWARKGRDTSRYGRFSDLAQKLVLPRLQERAERELAREDVEALSSLGM